MPHSILILLLLIPVYANAATGVAAEVLDLTHHWAGYAGLALFVIAYALVILEDQLQLRKSKPVMVAAGVIWAIVALVYAQRGDTHTVEVAIRHNLLEYAELFLFLLAAMTYINTMDERGIFGGIRAWLVARGFSLRAIFWLTGAMAFCISPIADNLTTALLMSTVVMTVAPDNRRFVAVACINIVVAANAGGAFSPFGDITTLMVWQKGVVRFEEFFALFLPSVVNWLVPAAFMGLAVPKSTPAALPQQFVLRHGALVVVGLFLLTIAMSVLGHTYLHLPPVIGMMTGLGILKLYGSHLTRRDLHMISQRTSAGHRAQDSDIAATDLSGTEPPRKAFNIFNALQRAEWDTLMFFYGVILCVGGLGLIGYLGLVSDMLYVDMGPTTANVIIGMLSAVVDNIPLMFAVLTMNPEMSHGQWLLVTLTTGTGGSLLSIGSAAGVAVMGSARGIYTFFAHLKWLWAIMLGYALSIWLHLVLNASLF